MLWKGMNFSRLTENLYFFVFDKSEWLQDIIITFEVISCLLQLTQ